MKIIIPGGSGQVGTILSRAFHQAGHEVVVLSRAPGPMPWRVVKWDGESLGDWIAELNGADVVINLAGRSVNCRYHAEQRRQIMDSRINSTRVLGEAIAQSSSPPRVWLQASTATIYAHRFDAPHDELTGVLGGAEPNAPDTWQFSIDVARSWEEEFNEANTPKTRKVLLRSAIVMTSGAGGAFDTLLRLVRFGLGGRVGDGRQYMSWIHEADFIRAVEWLIEHEEFEGVVNLAAPNPVPFSDFMKSLREAWGISWGLGASVWMVEIAAFFLQTESELILKSRRVIPGRLITSGFKFQFPL